MRSLLALSAVTANVFGGPRPMPSALGKYAVRAKVAEGGMAHIYLGRDSSAPTGQGVVALKVIKDELALNMDFVKMFVDEATFAMKLKHPNIVHISDFSADGDRIFLAMDFLMGQSLWNVWQACKERKIRLRYDMLAWICARVCDGLHYAHELKDAEGTLLGLVHRDVNATNVFVQYDGTVKIIDFGLAKAAGRMASTLAGVIKGKLAYMAPEQVMGGGVDRRADIFGLGVTLWELSVDRRLFKEKDDIETLKAVHEARVPDPTTLVHGYPPALWRVLKHALVRDKDARYPTAKELGAALDAFVAESGPGVSPMQVAEAMSTLFERERERQMAWVADASDVTRMAPGVTLNPPAAELDFKDMGSSVGPRPGTFEEADPNNPSDAPREPPHDVQRQDLVSPKIPQAPALPVFSSSPPATSTSDRPAADKPVKRVELDATVKRPEAPVARRGRHFVPILFGVLAALAVVVVVLMALKK